jgi:hypothetical protein
MEAKEIHSSLIGVNRSFRSVAHIAAPYFLFNSFLFHKVISSAWLLEGLEGISNE